MAEPVSTVAGVKVGFLDSGDILLELSIAPRSGSTAPQTARFAIPLSEAGELADILRAQLARAQR